MSKFKIIRSLMDISDEDIRVSIPDFGLFQKINSHSFLELVLDEYEGPIRIYIELEYEMQDNTNVFKFVRYKSFSKDAIYGYKDKSIHLRCDQGYDDLELTMILGRDLIDHNLVEDIKYLNMIEEYL